VGKIGYCPHPQLIWIRQPTKGEGQLRPWYFQRLFVSSSNHYLISTSNASLGAHSARAVQVQRRAGLKRVNTRRDTHTLEGLECVDSPNRAHRANLQKYATPVAIFFRACKNGWGVAPSYSANGKAYSIPTVPCDHPAGHENVSCMLVAISNVRCKHLKGALQDWSRTWMLE
jgi:hypothetical protein